MVHQRGSEVQNTDFLYIDSDSEISLKRLEEAIHHVNFVNSSKTQRADFPASVAPTPGQVLGRNVAEFVPGSIRIICFRFTRNCLPERCWFTHSSLIGKYFRATTKCLILHWAKEIIAVFQTSMTPDLMELKVQKWSH